MRIYPKGVTAECFNRESSSGPAWIPDRCFGNDGLPEIWEQLFTQEATGESNPQ
jgi:hypothetical protein